MKIFIVAFTALLSIGRSCYPAGTNAERFGTSSDYLLSKPTSNMAVVIQYPGENTRLFQSDQPIRFGFESMTSTVYDVFLLRPEYGCRIGATSESGQAVKRTGNGKRYGANFDDIAGVSRDAFDDSRLPGYARNMPYLTIARQMTPLRERMIPAPQELFIFDKPGIYSLRLEFQSFYCELRSSSTNLYLVKFPPVELKVLKIEQPVAVADHVFVQYIVEMGAVIIGIGWLTLSRMRAGVSHEGRLDKRA